MLKQLMICLALSFMVLAAQAQNQEKPKGDAQAAAPDNSMAAARKAATEDPNYTIGPQDVLDISVWKEPELTRSVPVRPDGKISMPLLNDVQAAGLSSAPSPRLTHQDSAKYRWTRLCCGSQCLLRSSPVFCLALCPRAALRGWIPTRRSKKVRGRISGRPTPAGNRGWVMPLLRWRSL